MNISHTNKCRIQVNYHKDQTIILGLNIILLILKLGGRVEFNNTLDDFLSSFSSLGREDDSVSISPSRNLEGLSWENVRSESGLDALELVGIATAESLNNSSSTDTIEAQSVKNWLIEATHGGHIGVSMEWVDVTSQSVEQGLVSNSLFFDNLIRLSFRDLGKSTSGFSLVAEATKSSNKESHSVNEDWGSSALLVDFVSGHFEGDEGSLALVSDIGDSSGGDELNVGLDGLEDFDLVFTVQNHHGIELGDAGAFGQGAEDLVDGDEGGTSSREDGEVVLEFVSVLKFFFVHGILTVTNT